MLNITCCLVIGLGLGLELALVSAWLAFVLLSIRINQGLFILVLQQLTCWIKTNDTNDTSKQTEPKQKGTKYTYVKYRIQGHKCSNINIG